MIKLLNGLTGRKKMLLTMAFAIVVVSAGTYAATAFMPGGPMRSHAAAAFDNVVELLAGRSPGERGAASITKGKPGVQHALGKSTEPVQERALGKVFAPRVPPLGEEIAFPELADLSADMPGTGPGVEFPGVSPGSPPGGTNRSSNPPGPSPVPELSTWAGMIIGMGICGAALRRRRSRMA